MKIIFVDDSPVVLRTLGIMIKEILENSEHMKEIKDNIDAVFYSSSEKLLEEFKNEENFYFDLAFFDINMPKVSGYDLTKEVRKIDRFKFKPIIAITTEISTHSKRLGKNAGMTGWLVKTSSNQIVKDNIEKLIRRFYK
jgi:two-component system chemotaxis response regulator CheY